MTDHRHKRNDPRSPADEHHRASHFRRPDEVPAYRAAQLEEVAEPAAGEGEVLVRVQATSVNPADWHFLRGEPYVMRAQAGLRRPKNSILGCELAGRVEALGPNVASLQPGDEVFGCTAMRGFGGFAERAAVSADLLV
jgi:NADPH:quinone reductase-like Zn-dependent oxidoreductase